MSLRIAEGPMRIFPGFSRLGKCDSRERSESEHQRCVARVPWLQPEWNSPLRSVLRIALRLFGQKGKESTLNALLHSSNMRAKKSKISSCTLFYESLPVLLQDRVTVRVRLVLCSFAVALPVALLPLLLDDLSVIFQLLLFDAAVAVALVHLM